MSDAPNIFQDKLRRIRERFRESMRQKLDELRTLSQKLAGQSDQALLLELRRVSHSLAGLPVGVAHPDMNRRATLLENMVDSILREDPGTDTQTDYTEELRSLIEGVEKYAAETPLPDFDFIQPTRERNERQLFIVDDDPDFSADLSEQLHHFGYDCTLFDRPEKAEAALNANGPQPAAVLMDISFSGDHSAGLDAARRLQTPGGNQIPLLFLSAREDLEARLEAIRAGGRAYISKPIYITALVDKLDELLGVSTEEMLRVMIVEDDAVLASYYSLILEQAGVHSTHLADPGNIFNRLIDFRPDLIVMDQYLDRDYLGSDLARVINQHEQFFDIPVVFLSTETSIDVHFTVLGAGGDIFLTKPVLPEHLIAVVRKKAKRSRKLHSLAVRDSLTRLLNHAAAKEELGTLLAQAERQGHPLSLAMIDLDYFKQVNDTHGHATGDRVLLALARILKQRLRKSDVIARYGGEEFLIVMPSTPREGAVQVMDEIRTHFNSLELSGHGGQRFQVSFSCGIAENSQATGGPGLIDAADQALYRAKDAGRNQVYLFQGPTEGRTPAEGDALDATGAAPVETDAAATEDQPADSAERRRYEGTEDSGPRSGMLKKTPDLEEAPIERLKNEFLSMINHELRTPLTGLRGAISLLLGNIAGELPQRAIELLQVAEGQGERLSRLIHDLLDMEQIETGRIRYRFESCDLVHLVRTGVRDAAAYAAEAGVQIEFSCKEEEILLGRLDPIRMRKLIDQLLHNAIKFSPKNSTVSVSLKQINGPRGRLVRFAVTDRGPGIPEAFHDRVFNKFAVADASTARSRGGIGLGLSMCRAIVRHHGGQIHFKTDPSSGTTFYFELKDRPNDGPKKARNI